MAEATTDLGPALTEDEVRLLPDGAPITVTWSGGNGPHPYVLVRQGGDLYAARNQNPADPFRYYNPLTFVGTERFHTRVWVRHDDVTAATTYRSCPACGAHPLRIKRQYDRQRGDWIYPCADCGDTPDPAPEEGLSIYGRNYTADGWPATNLPISWEDTDG